MVQNGYCALNYKSTWWGFSHSQNHQFCLSTYSWRWKCASSQNKMYLKSILPLSTILIVFATSNLLTPSLSVIGWMTWIFQGKRAISTFKIQWIVLLFIRSFLAACLTKVDSYFQRFPQLLIIFCCPFLFIISMLFNTLPVALNFSYFLVIVVQLIL